MANLTPQVVVLAGITPATVTAAELGDEFVNSGRAFIHILNTGAEMVVTIDSQAACNQGSDHDIEVTVPLTTGEKFIGPFPKDRFNDANEKVQITYSRHTDVTIGIVEVP